MDSAPRPADASPPEVPRPGDWRSALEPPRDPGTEPPRFTPLALQFELREQTPRSLDRWRGPTARRATGAPGTPGVDHRLGVRPVTRGRSGKWTRQGVGWSSVPHQTHRLGLDPAQQSWFQQFVALHRATRAAYTGQDADWLYLDEFLSPLLWPLLAQAEGLGIELVGTPPVERAGLASLHLDATRHDDAAGASLSPAMRLTAVVELDGVPHSPERAAAIGDHGLYLVTPTAITLAPVVGRLSDNQLRLLGRPPEVVIPGDDVSEFLTRYYPRMRRGLAFTSSDGGVEFPAAPPPVLVLRLRHGPAHELTLDWRFEYVDDGEPHQVPVRPGAGSGVRGEGEGQPGASDGMPGAGDGVRDAEEERRLLDRVGDLAAVTPSPRTLRGVDAAVFAAEVVPALGALDGVRVEVSGVAPDYRELTEVPRLSIRVLETDRRDWFDLGVTVTVDGREVPFQPLFSALSRGRTKLLMVDGSYLSLTQPVFDRLRELIEEASTLSEWETGPRISRYQASLLADFEDLADETSEAVAWRTAVGRLVDARLEPTAVPAGLRAELRPYQKAGFDWLAFLWRHGLGGILADDMGLGKTLQSLALVAHAIEERGGAPGAPFLVVAPTSVVSNWGREAARFTPGLRVEVIDTTERKHDRSIAERAAGADLVVTSYALFRLDVEAYRSVTWAGALFDEAQFLKNPASRVHACANELDAPLKLALTGTPLENSLTDLWALFAITAPGLFPSLGRFTEQYVRPVGRGSSAQARRAAGAVGVSGAAADAGAEAHAAALLARLRARIRPLMMRRTKELVAAELPERQEQELRIDLAPDHRRLYDTVLQRERQKILGLIDDLDRNKFIVFRSLTLLRLLSLDASLIDPAHAGVRSSKLDALEEQLADVVAEGHRALIFSQFTSYLRVVAARLEAAGIPHLVLDGSTRRRAEVIDAFRSGTAPVFLISLKAGGFGLTLTEADYVFLLDPWWNPAAERQAIDRTHRIGQTRTVMVYRMIAAGTIEEKVMALAAQKSALADAVLGDDDVFSEALTADDIRGLLDA
ncbi:DEAD/DEAH box helicase [Galbitalea soli]|uniref:DEAD/DEAH box helicase n=1 Tax=Galbitalea soli TaxID=1268042 RepID=A0A7C9PM92_9MICO|nr:DEAD/DEAH box helicase [Galbitalea soli]NEM90793.1 DEAD/DEAH box helicase [Galbitalea soli]NYJ31511.1 superfamily II DNA or RNA helicase [Galbitalea soli]